MIAALSVPEHCLSFYFVCCDDQIHPGEGWSGEGGGGCAGGGGAEPPFKTLLSLLPVTFSQLDPQLGVGCRKGLVF